MIKIFLRIIVKYTISKKVIPLHLVLFSFANNNGNCSIIVFRSFQIISKNIPFFFSIVLVEVYSPYFYSNFKFGYKRFFPSFFIKFKINVNT